MSTPGSPVSRQRAPRGGTRRRITLRERWMRRAGTTGPLPLLLVAALVVTGLAATGWQAIDGPGDEQAAEQSIDFNDLELVSNRCRGGAAFRNSGCTVSTKSGGFSGNATDRASVYSRNCIAQQPNFTYRRCELGVTSGARLKVAFVGNSVASQWADTIGTIAKSRRWRVTSYLASSCTANTTRGDWGNNTTARDKCLDWGNTVRRSIINNKYDVVVYTASASRYEGQRDPAAGFESWFRSFAQRGIGVVVIKRTAMPGTLLRQSVTTCLRSNPRNYHACGTEPRRTVFADPVQTAATRLRSAWVHSFGMTDFQCTNNLCPTVIGGVLAYYDKFHMTPTYTRTTAPYLNSKLVTMFSRVERARG